MSVPVSGHGNACPPYGTTWEGRKPPRVPNSTVPSGSQHHPNHPPSQAHPHRYVQATATQAPSSGCALQSHHQGPNGLSGPAHRDAHCNAAMPSDPSLAPKGLECLPVLSRSSSDTLVTFVSETSPRTGVNIWASQLKAGEYVQHPMTGDDVDLEGLRVVCDTLGLESSRGHALGTLSKTPRPPRQRQQQRQLDSAIPPPPPSLFKALSAPGISYLGRQNSGDNLPADPRHILTPFENDDLLGHGAPDNRSSTFQLASPDAFMRYGFTLEGALMNQHKEDDGVQDGENECARMEVRRRNLLRETMSPGTAQVSRLLDSLNVDGPATTDGQDESPHGSASSSTSSSPSRHRLTSFRAVGPDDDAALSSMPRYYAPAVSSSPFLEPQQGLEGLSLRFGSPSMPSGSCYGGDVPSGPAGAHLQHQGGSVVELNAFAEAVEQLRQYPGSDSAVQLLMETAQGFPLHTARQPFERQQSDPGGYHHQQQHRSPDRPLRRQLHQHVGQYQGPVEKHFAHMPLNGPSAAAVRGQSSSYLLPPSGRGGLLRGPPHGARSSSLSGYPYDASRLMDHRAGPPGTGQASTYQRQAQRWADGTAGTARNSGAASRSSFGGGFPPQAFAAGVPSAHPGGYGGRRHGTPMYGPHGAIIMPPMPPERSLSEGSSPVMSRRGAGWCTGTAGDLVSSAGFVGMQAGPYHVKQRKGSPLANPAWANLHVATGGNNANMDGLGAGAVFDPSRYDPVAAKRAELVESPTTRMQFKDFYRQFRSKERCSFEAAKEYALACFDLLPNKVHWKLYLELADLAKRENRITDARRLYKKVCHLQPHASQGWLEYSKMEEECGDLEGAMKIIRQGLSYCEYSESLLARAIKHEERKKNYKGARELLGRLRHLGVDKVWRTVLEGALLEARVGNNAVARKVFKYLMAHVPWYGPIYYEFGRLEEKREQPLAALAIAERGLKEIPRYGPLWFASLRLYERLDLHDGCDEIAMGRVPPMARTRDAIVRALRSISKELIWKVHFEAAQIEERVASLAAASKAAKSSAAADHAVAAQPTNHGSVQAPHDGSTDASNIAKVTVAQARHELLDRCRRCYVDAVLTSPANLRWKVWLAGARTELGTGRVEAARSLLNRAFQEVPEKSKAHVFLECARLEEFVGSVDRARKILVKSRAETRAEWKVFLESVLLEMRAGQWQQAVDEAQSALKIHTGTGRLWAVLVQLKYLDGDAAQLDVLRQALLEVPKSGEVWCEGARIHLSPVSRCFDLDVAEKYLDFAIQFTPQYGDSFLELLRSVMVRHVILPRAIRTLDAEESVPRPDAKEFLDTPTEELELRGSTADPNYGSFWFHCRDMPSDTPRLIMRRAKNTVANDVWAMYPLYLKALVRRLRVERELRAELTKQQAASNTEQVEQDGEQVHAEAVAAPAVPQATKLQVVDFEKRLERALQNAEPIEVADDDVPEDGLGQWDFVMGMVALNRVASSVGQLPDEVRLKILFGSDQLMP